MIDTSIKESQRIVKNAAKISGCGDLNVTHGQVTLEENVGGETRVTVTCQKRYVLIGQEDVTCQPNGAWSSTPECRKCGK